MAAPIVYEEFGFGSEDTPLVGILLHLADSDQSNGGGTPPTFHLTSLPAHGTLYTDLPANGGVPLDTSTAYVPQGFDGDTGRWFFTLVFVPDPDWNGDTSFQYTAVDSGNAVSSPASVLLSVAAVADPTAIDLNGPGSGTSTDLTFTENDPILALGTDAVVTDESATFDGATLTATFTSGGMVDDLLRLAGGSITVDETSVYDGGTLIGQISGGTDPDTPLVVTLNADATLASVQALVRQIGFVNYSATPIPGDRVVEIVLTDAGGGASEPVTSTIHVVAIPDAPVAMDDQIYASEDLVQIGSVFADNGNGPDSDPDGPALQVSEVNGSAANVGQPIMLPSGAIFQLNSDGSFSFDPNGGYDSLSDVETAQEQFTYTLAGGNSATVHITINGANDAPVFSVVAGDSAGAALVETNSGLNAAGVLSVVDPEPGDSVTLSLAGVAASGTTTGLGLSNSALLAMFAVGPSAIPADPGSTHNVSWTFDSGGQAFDYLDDGESLTLSYTVRATDDHGASSDQTVSIVVNGTNDGPSLAIVPGDSATANLAETDAALTASGTMTTVDPDLSDSVTPSVLSVAATGTTAGLSSSNAALLAMLSLPANVAADLGSTNNLGWAFDSGAESFDYLGVGQTVTLNYVVRVTDDSGASADQPLTITIQGSNDAPVIVPPTDAFGMVTELADHAPGENVATLSDSGTIFFADRDLTDMHSSSWTAQSGGYLGTFTLGPVNQGADKVGWSFSVSDAALNSLGDAVVLKQYYDVTIDDGHGGTVTQTVEVDLHGTNDAAILTSANVIVPQGPTPVSASGDLDISDEDDPALFVVQSNTAGHYGHFSIDADGNWSYLADAAYILGPNQVLSEVFTVLAVDGTPTTVAVTIQGIDQPGAAHDDLFTTNESSVIGAGRNLFADNGSGPDSDPDTPLVIGAVNGNPANVGHSLLLASGARVIVNSNGTFSYDTNGAWTGLSGLMGASNHFGHDSFTYTLAGGGTATVYMNIVGEVTPGDISYGSGGDDNILGSSANDTIRLDQSGHDHATGEGGNDGFYFGSTLDTLDSVDGGTGNDTVALQGNTNVVLGDIRNVEVIALLSGTNAAYGDTANNRYDYSLTTNDGNVAAGETLTVIGTALLPGEDLHFDGSAETNGNFRIFAGQGVDDLTGGAGNDGFFFGADGNLTGADHVNGGAGTDSIALRGNYVGANAVAFQDGSFSNVEVLAMLSGHSNEYGGVIVPGGYDYDVTMANGNVAGGRTFDVSATGLKADESLRFDGRLETDAFFRIFSGAGNDTLYGGGQNDMLYGGLGKDWMEGGPGADTYIFRSAAESTSIGYDTISGFDYTADRIDAPGGGGRSFSQSATGNLSLGSFDADLASGLSGVLGAGQAALFTASGGSLAGHVFAVIDVNGVAGYQAGQDLVIELLNPVLPIDPSAGVIV